MRIISIKALKLEECKVIRFPRFKDQRGYFAEHFQQEEFDKLFKKELNYPYARFLQANESRSRKGVIRGLHFQWDPYMGKLVRTLYGHMVDMVLDIRVGSPTCGKILFYDMPFDAEADYAEWIWVPPGFAHGNFYLEDSAIEYFCTGEYNPRAEAGISPLSKDIDWSYVLEGPLKTPYGNLIREGAIMSDKDRQSHSFKSWMALSKADHFTYKELR
ncbi:MAG: dTDP-4-dehydrorhamnose 3,5-epimerase family protein [Deltaproteobacteria bacterium]|jgi:dTDP-4-dehydrorhamnose 3,5-epimerase|nr:dTDP-4-dehydrorhamnose 3,5-epimerase family protein [Deltaproteobacteria bacterium]